jgi:alanyl-tRNA synthetase
MVKPLCSSEKKVNPVNVIRKNFEKIRSESLKDNFNKLMVIAASDIKEYSDFFKELDEIHKKELSQLADNLKEQFSNSNPSSPVKVIDDENIFVDKD